MNDEPHGQSRNDEEQQYAHSRGRSPVICGTSGLPVAPLDFRFHDGDDRRLIRHRSTSDSSCMLQVYGPALTGAVR
jgi:hypothetical protein